MRPPSLPGLVPFLLSLCLMASGTASAQVTIHLVTPESTLTREDFVLTVQIDSSRQLEWVQAEFGGRVIPMPVQPRSTANLSIAGLAYGEHLLTVTVRDVTGREAKVSRALQVDRPARIVVASPLNGTVARPSVRLQVGCEDDGPQGCQVRVQTAVEDPRDTHRPRTREWVSDVSATRVFDQEMCLSEYVGKQVVFVLSADDGQGPGSVVERFVAVEDSRRLTPVVSAPGVVLDFDAQRLLFSDEERAFVMDRATGAIEALTERRAEVQSGQLSFDSGHLVPGGALLLRNSELFRVREGKLTRLAGAPRVSPRAIYQLAGSFLAYYGGDRSSYYLHNLVTGTEGIIEYFSQSAFSIAEDGTLLTTSGGTTLVRKRDGRDEAFALVKGQVYNLVWDGTDALFDLDRKTVLLREGKQYVLADVVSATPYPTVRGLLTRGWTAFSRLGGGVAQVWLRSPEGVESQASSSGKTSVPLLLGPQGSVIYESDARYHLASPTTPSEVFAHATSSRLSLDNGVAYMALGQTLFRVDPTASGDPLSCPAVHPPPEAPEKPWGWGCSSAGEGSVWFLLLALLRLVRTGAHAYVQRRPSHP